MSSQPMKIDVDKVLRDRLPKHYKYIPRFVVRWLERTICQDQLNAILLKMADKNSVDAATAALDEMNITIDATGLERLPDGRFMFVSNHPLGGLDGLALISLLGGAYGSRGWKSRGPFFDCRMTLSRNFPSRLANSETACFTRSSPLCAAP